MEERNKCGYGALGDALSTSMEPNCTIDCSKGVLSMQHRRSKNGANLRTWAD